MKMETAMAKQITLTLGEEIAILVRDTLDSHVEDWLDQVKQMREDGDDDDIETVEDYERNAKALQGVVSALDEQIERNID
jgi:hypothetical protein